MSSKRLAKRIPSRGQKGSRVGAAVVEFAFVAPIMILLTMGMMEVGRMVMVKQMLIHASREGARAAALPGATSLGVQAKINEELESLMLNDVQITMKVNGETQDLESASKGDTVSIGLAVPAASVSWVPQPVFALNQSLSAETTMRKESL
ncbi:MAG: pilus assembly protein [Planctomycetales bacterium]|nr:pilus assembly protein [Planctomycetales bacterium]